MNDISKAAVIITAVAMILNAFSGNVSFVVMNGFLLVILILLNKE